MSAEGKELERKFQEGFENMVPDEGTRQIILNSIEVFSKKGLVGTKVKDIAAKAGFSQGYIYNYFKSKDEIFIKILNLAAEGAENSVKYAAELKGTPYERIYWLTEAFLSPDSIAMKHWRLIMLQAAATEAILEEALKEYNEKMKNPVKCFISLIIEGQKAGEIVEEDPVVLAVTYFSIIQGLGITRIQNGNGAPFPSIDLILKFLKKA